MARGVNAGVIFIDDQDRREFLRLLERIMRQSGATIYAYCLMGNHFHLAVRVGSVPLASIMQRILTGYAGTFNRKYDRIGHLFDARYRSNICTDGRYLVSIIRYIHMNPVRAGLTTRPDDWPWSSYNEYRQNGIEGLLPFESDLPDFDPWKAPTVENPVSLLRRGGDAELPLDSIGAEVAERTAISIAELRSGSKCRVVVDAKRLLVETAIRNGHSLSAVAGWLGTSRGTVGLYLLERNRRNYRPDTIKSLLSAWTCRFL